MQILVGVHAADDATLLLPSMTSIPSLLVRPCFDGFAKTECVDRTVTRPDGQALLGSQASARQNLTARRSRAADRSKERHGWSIGVWVRPHRDALRRQPTKRSIGVESQAARELALIH